jgi:type IV pilus assembly protein PilC
MYDGFVIRIPYVCDIIYDTQRAWFLDSLALLVHGGMPLVPALSVAERSCVNSKIFEYLATVTKAVSAGTSLSVALEQCPGNLFSPETIAIIAVGENVGQLGTALAQAADVSRSCAARSLAFIVTVLQPLLFIVLGLLITMLILAVYAPIFTLSWAI